jgi:hypothetical protein
MAAKPKADNKALTPDSIATIEDALLASEAASEGDDDFRNQLRLLLDEYGDEPEHSGDWNPMDAFGGNFDDAYNGGVRDGAAELAARIRLLLEG